MVRGNKRLIIYFEIKGNDCKSRQWSFLCRWGAWRALEWDGLIGTWIGNFNSTSWRAGQTTESDVNLISTTQYDWSYCRVTQCIALKSTAVGKTFKDTNLLQISVPEANVQKFRQSKVSGSGSKMHDLNMKTDETICNVWQNDLEMQLKLLKLVSTLRHCEANIKRRERNLGQRCVMFVLCCFLKIVCKSLCNLQHFKQ